METKKNDTGAPIPDEVTRITNVIVTELGTCDLESALTVLVNITGQVVASLADGQPGNVRKQAELIVSAIRMAAVEKLLYDDNKKRGH